MISFRCLVSPNLSLFVVLGDFPDSFRDFVDFSVPFPLSQPKENIGIIERGVPQAYVRARASSATLCSVHVLRVFLYIFYIKQGNLIRIKTGLDTYLIRIQTRTPLSRYPPYDYSGKSTYNKATSNILERLPDTNRSFPENMGNEAPWATRMGVIRANQFRPSDSCESPQTCDS